MVNPVIVDTIDGGSKVRTYETLSQFFQSKIGDYLCWRLRPFVHEEVIQSIGWLVFEEIIRNVGPGYHAARIGQRCRGVLHAFV